MAVAERSGGTARFLQRSRLATSLAIAAVITLPDDRALAGAWTLEAGKGEVIATGLYSSAWESFPAADGDPAAVGFAKTSASLFFEHGWTDRLTIVGDLEIGSESDAASGYARSGPSHFAAGARLRLFKAAGFVTSAQLTGRLEEAGDGLDSPAIEPRLLAGYGFSVQGMPAFVDGQAGYRWRAGGADEVKLDLSAGIRPFDDWLLLAQFFSTMSVGSERYSHHKAQGSIVYDINTRWSVQAGAFATIAGENALKERGVVSAIWYRY